jgi:hypothetical protein
MTVFQTVGPSGYHSVSRNVGGLPRRQPGFGGWLSMFTET